MTYQFDFGWLAEYWPVLLRGIGITLELIAVGGVLGIALGIACAWARALGPAWLRPDRLGLCRADPQHAVPDPAVLHLLRPALARRADVAN